MSEHILRPGGTPPVVRLPAVRRRFMAAAAVSAVVFLAACSSPAPEDSPAASPSGSATTAASTAPSTTPAATAAPSATSAMKELVAGFPSGVLPLMKNAQIQASSIEHAEPVSTASLTATVTAGSADVLAYYTKVLTDQKFTAQPGDSVDGVPLKSFVRAEGQESVTVSVIQTGSTATFTLGASLLPASFK